MIAIFTPTTSVSFCGCLFVRREGERWLLSVGLRGGQGSAGMCAADV